MLSVIDVMLQRHLPWDIVDLGYIVSVGLQSTQELVETKSGVSGHLCDTDRRARGLEGTGDDNTSNVVDGHHVDSVVDVGTSRELNASLHHSNEEIVRVGG